jgi:hypothetical protein
MACKLKKGNYMKGKNLLNMLIFNNQYHKRRFPAKTVKTETAVSAFHR